MNKLDGNAMRTSADMRGATTDPAKCPRRVLFLVTGLSPAIVTETLYALATRQVSPFVPTEVHLLTTGYGARIAKEALFGRNCAFKKLLDEYPVLSNVAFSEQHIAVISDQRGTVLDDVVTPQDNQDAADLITEAIRRFTRDIDTALHVSLAGGRKTMGFFAGYALSLFGRVQDRLSHVLLPSSIETCREFYFPSRNQPALKLPDGREVASIDVEIMLAEIPIVRLRHGIPRQLIEGTGTYRSVVAAAQAAIGSPHVHINIVKRRLTCAERDVAMQPLDFAVYYWFADRVLNHAGDGARVDRHTGGTEFVECYGSLFGRNSGEFGRIKDGLDNTLKGGTIMNWLRERVSRVNKKLEGSLGSELAIPYKIKLKGKRGSSSYGLDLTVDSIQIAHH